MVSNSTKAKTKVVIVGGFAGGEQAKRLAEIEMLFAASQGHFLRGAVNPK